MDDAILITELNDFIFCPASIYFHKLYGSMDKMIYQSTDQINGTAAHKNIDEKKYSTKKSVLMATDVFCEKYNLIGKIDIYDIEKRLLRERKKHIKSVYDGYVFQLYAQYFALVELNYEVNQLQLYSIDNHKIFEIKRPDQNPEMLDRFENTIYEIRNFDLNSFEQRTYFSLYTRIL